MNTLSGWTPFSAVPEDSHPLCPDVKPITMSHWKQLSRSRFRLMEVAAWE